MHIITLAEWLLRAAQQLTEANVPTARLDAEVLLAEIMQKDRSYILAHGDERLDHKLHTHLDMLLQRRVKHEPLAYILGRSEFYGRTFEVSKNTLVPRPETETMIEEFLRLQSQEPVKTVADIGTGSGAIAITVKLESPNMAVYGTDIDKKCIQIASHNSSNHSAEVVFYEGSMLTPLHKVKIDVVLANLPYVPDSHTINQAAMYEPNHAIFGGEDGLDLYRLLFEEASILAVPYIFTESLPPQHLELNKIARIRGYKLLKSSDLIQIFKYSI